MNRRFRQMWIAGFFMLALLLSACDSDGSPSAPTTTPTNTPSSTPATPPSAAPPTATSVAIAPSTPSSAGGSTRDMKTVSGGLEKLKSYHTQFAYHFDGKNKNGQPQKGSLDFNQEILNTSTTTKDEHLKLTSSGTLPGASNSSDNDGAAEVYRVGGSSFTIQNGTCQFLSSGSSGTGAGRAVFTADDFFGNMNKAVVVGRGETVNGVSADHYAYTEFSGSKNLAGFKVQKGDVWIAADGYVVKIAGQATGKTTDGAAGTIRWEYHVNQINQVAAITVPPDCVAPVQATDVPLPANATDTRVVTADDGGQTLTTFKSRDPIKTVADFFRQSLPAQAWNVDGDKGSGAASIQLTFSKDNSTRKLTVSVIAQSTGSSVIITDKK